MTTYVLVHGAYQGGWIWKLVATQLRAAGHDVYAPTLDGCGERHHMARPGITVTTQAREIAQLLFYEDIREARLVSLHRSEDELFLRYRFGSIGG